MDQSLKRITFQTTAIKPDTNKNHLRLYGHNLCPFVARARYALALNQVPFQEAFICLNNKAQWHLNFNGGLVPILETPNGDLIKESGVIMSFAHESGTGAGVPKDPVAASFMRLEMEAFNGKLSSFFPILMSRGEDDDKIDKFAAEALPYFEEICRKSEGKFLFRTQEPTLLDCHVAPMLEILVQTKGSAYNNVFERLDLANTGKHIIEYVQRFQDNELIHPFIMNKIASDAHSARSRGWDKTVKCQLSLEVLEGAFTE